MKKLQRIMLAGALGLVSLGTLRADPPTISGYIDTTYNYDFNKPFTDETTLRIYDLNNNNMTLNTAHLNFTGSVGEVGYVIETDYGSDAMATSGAADDFDVQEAYFTYACPKTLIDLKVGKFATPEGIEVIESKDNPTISRGFLYGWAEPFTHTGFMVSRAFGKLDLGVGVVNGWDQPRDFNDGKTFVGKIGLNFGDPLAVTITGYHGPEQTNVYGTAFTSDTMKVDGHNRSTVDLTAVTKIIPKVALWFQLNYGQEDATADKDGDGTKDDLGKWGGATIQPVISITDKFSLGARWEVFEDQDGARTSFDNLSVRNITIAPAYKMTDNLTFRVEYRMDESNQKIWVDDKGKLEDSANTATAQFIVTF